MPPPVFPPTALSALKFLFVIILNLKTLGKLADGANLLRPVTYVHYANGRIQNNATVLESDAVSVFQCGVICRQQLVCSAFSVVQQSAATFTCSIALGDYTWVADSTSSLYAEDVGDLRGYALAPDGKFYKLFPDANLTYDQSRLTCTRDERGNLAVPFPKFQFQTVLGLVGGGAYSFYVGISRTSNHTLGRWITDDGAVFNANDKNSDPNQVWRLNEPNGNSDVASIRFGSALDDSNPALGMSLLCRRFSHYRRAASNGKYYRVYQDSVNASEAADRCAADGGSLANVASELDFDATEHFRMQHKGSFSGWNYGLWIAGSDAALEGIWTFPDGKTMDVSLRTTDPFVSRFFVANFVPQGNASNCLMFTYGGVVDRPCSAKRRFLCQIPEA